jgi:outer membrane protein, multidrug efflux system
LTNTAKLLHILTITLLSGCVSGPAYKSPSPIVAAAYRSQDQRAARQSLGPMSQWWKSFDDPVLDSLIERALSSNLDVESALSRVKESRAGLSAANAVLLPTLSGSASATQSAAGSPSVTTTAASYGLDTSWEVDLWGGKRRETEAASARVEQAVADVNAARLALMAELANAYIDARSAQARLANARSAVQTKRDTLGLTRTKVSAGLTSEGDAFRAEASLAQSESQIPDFESDIRRSVNRIAVLSAMSPGDLDKAIGKGRKIPAFKGKISAGIPADLARRRPDIIKAERELAAATAEVGVAQADLYPKLTLTGNIGGNASKSGGVTISVPGTWSFGPNISLPIFDGGKRRSARDIRIAKADQALIAWKNTVLTAVEEVENGLVRAKNERKKYAALQRSAASYSKSSKQARELYEKGLTSFLDVLDAERSLIEAKDARLQSEAQIARNAVLLCKALGGGW